MAKLKVTMLLEVEVTDPCMSEHQAGGVTAFEVYGQHAIGKQDLYHEVLSRLNWGDHHPGHPLFSRDNVRVTAHVFPGRRLL